MFTQHCQPSMDHFRSRVMSDGGATAAAGFDPLAAPPVRRSPSPTVTGAPTPPPPQLATDKLIVENGNHETTDISLSPADQPVVIDNSNANAASTLSPPDDDAPATLQDILLDDNDEVRPPENSTPLRLDEAFPAPSLAAAATNSLNATDTAAKIDSENGNATSTSSQIDSEKPYTLQITIVDFEKRGDGMNAYLVYRIQTRAEGVVGLSDQTYIVYRRFSDFLGLRERLAEKYLHKGIILAPAPEKSISALTKTKTTSDPQLNNHDFALRRSRALQRFLRRLGAHPRIRVDCDFRDFLTLTADLPRSDQTAALSSAGVKRMLKSVSDVFAKMAFHMDETDRWFDQAQTQLDELTDELGRLHSHAEALAQQRRELAVAHEQLAKSLGLLASCEEHTALARSLSHVTEAHDQAALHVAEQADADLIRFTETTADWLGMLGALREVFGERSRVWQNWQQQQQTIARKRELKARHELASRSDKAAGVRAEIDEAIVRAELLEKEFRELGDAIKEEVARFEKERRVDFQHTLVHYLESIVVSQEKLLKVWERLAPETRSIVTF